ncbi:head-tail connector protein [Roseibium sp. RKSG952]|uniref:head-tail connector protein n=1 Tax=Roseibium sp. RKSG952 TaxID=2529384 RepID=UPI0012BD1D21|nr:head-tail connector protein [Roseibium sp. RKSG952]MTH95855.1 hypothetical protein [Roseibium sp. RKSG952]
MTVHLESPPAVEPVSLDDMRKHLRLVSTAEDGTLASLITAARSHVEQATRRALITQGWRMFLDAWPPGRVVPLPLAPVSQLDQILVYDLDGMPTTLDPDAWVLLKEQDPPRLKVAAGAGYPAQGVSGIEIGFTAGYGPAAEDVPAGLKQAVKLLAAHWFENREAGSDRPVATVPVGFDRLVLTNRVPLL